MNLAESYMNIRAQFDGGKQINIGSWHARCAGVGLRVNEGTSWGPKAWEMVPSAQQSGAFISVANENTKKINTNWKRNSMVTVETKRKKEG